MPAAPAAGERITITCPSCWRLISVDLGVPVDPGPVEDDEMWPARVALAFHLRTGCTRWNPT